MVRKAAYAYAQRNTLPLAPTSGTGPRWSCHIVDKLGSSALANGQTLLTSYTSRLEHRGKKGHRHNVSLHKKKILGQSAWLIPCISATGPDRKSRRLYRPRFGCKHLGDTKNSLSPLWMLSSADLRRW